MMLEKEKGETTMKRKLANVLILLITSMLIVSILPAYAGYPDNPTPATSMWIEPVTIPSTSRIFTITVWINTTHTGAYDTTSGAGCSGAFQFTLLYNEAHLDLIDYGTDDQYFFQNITTWGYVASPTIGPGSFLGWESWKSGLFRAPGYGTLMWLTFNMTEAIPKGGEVSGTLDLDKEDCYVLDGDTGEDYLDVVYDATYDYEWAAPPPPGLGVDSASFSKYTNWTGTTFPIEVWISDLDPEWYLTNASITLCFNTSLINTTDTDVVVDALWATSTVTVLHGDPDNVTIFVADPTTVPPGGAKVLIATITFTVVYQGTYPDVDVSPLSFCDYLLMDHIKEIVVEWPPADGEVIIEGLLPLPLPYLEVIDPTDGDNDIVMGPDPDLGEEFTVDVQIKNLHFAWNLVILEFRMTYCPDLIEFMYGEEGPYFQMFTQPRDNPPYTYYEFYDEGDHILYFDFILPMENGTYIDEDYPLPGGEPPDDMTNASGTIATLHFKVIKQVYPETFCCNLSLFETLMLDKDGTEVPYDIPQNGTYCIVTAPLPGRMIDIYTQYPPPYGGQGLMNPSDMFWPQKEVILCANVTYNFWPVQQKLVTFDVWDPQEHLWTKLQGLSDANGVACASFRIPWPCDDPESLIGVWRVKACVDIACEVVCDELEFHFDYLVADLEVETSKYSYRHCEDVEITVTFTSHAQQPRQVAIRVTIHDELNVPIATAVEIFYVEGAEFCTAEEYEKIFVLHLEKWAFVGYATIHAVPVMKWEGSWVAAGPEGTAEIFIEPFWA
jgi:hypothetical protein